MGYWDALAGVFSAQLIIWFFQWFIKEYIEPRWKKLHENMVKNGTKVAERIGRGLK